MASSGRAADGSAPTKTVSSRPAKTLSAWARRPTPFARRRYRQTSSPTMTGTLPLFEIVNKMTDRLMKLSLWYDTLGLAILCCAGRGVQAFHLALALAAYGRRLD